MAALIEEHERRKFWEAMDAIDPDEYEAQSREEGVSPIEDVYAAEERVVRGQETEQLHNMEPDSVALTAGDLDDDIQTMREYLGSSGAAPALWHELNHLIGIIRALEATTLP